MKTKSTFIDLTIEPDNQSPYGKTLDNLLLYLQWYPFILNMIPTDPNHKDYKAFMGIKTRCAIWEDSLQKEGKSISRSGEYITNSIRINLKAGEYKISTMVRVFTAVDFAITGKGNETVVRFLKYDFVKEPFHWYNPHIKGRNCVALFACPWEAEKNPAFKRDNCFTLRDFNIRLEDGLWFPYKNPAQTDPVAAETTNGALISYVNFHEANLSNLNIVAENNGEITLIDADECDHQEITDCYLYLNNWHDRFSSDKWLHIREQGANLNIRGNNKSVLVTRNTFVKHGNDEALTFLGGGNILCSNDITHENILVCRNKFTYLDAIMPITGTPDIPVIPDIPDISDEVVVPAEVSSDDCARHGEVETTDNGAAEIPRPVHINGVLISFGPLPNAKNVWRNVIFSENVIYLQGPAQCAVAMNIVRGEYRDEYHNIVFSNNRIYHSYHDSGLTPGNGALHYLYTNSFSFQIFPNADGLSLHPADEELSSDSYDTGPEDATLATSASTTTDTELVSYYGNSIYYSQHTRDYQDPKVPTYRLAYEHSCFKLKGGNVCIHDNFIDGTKAEVQRLEGADGLYGKADNPISLLHCMPCKVEGDYNVSFCNNQAYGYGVVLRCRNQYDFNEHIDNYDIHMSGNSLYDGAAIVVYDIASSRIAIVQNRFFNCTADFIQGDILKEPEISICQNMFDSDHPGKDYRGHLFAPWTFAGDSVGRLYVMANCLIGYTSGSLTIEKDKPAILYADCNSGNIIASKSHKEIVETPDEVPE